MALWYERYGLRPLAQYLIQRGSPINLWDALWLADTPHALALAATVDVNANGPNGFTYLHLAAMLGNVSVVERLLARKANVKARADKAWTPLHVAMGGSPGRGPMGVTWHRYGLPTGREGIVRALLATGANPNQKDSDERTPLEWGIEYQAPSLLRLVLKAGGNPNQKQEYGSPLLFAAIKTKNPEVVRVLLDAGADPRVRGYNESALQYARAEKQSQIVELIKMALKTKR